MANAKASAERHLQVVSSERPTSQYITEIGMWWETRPRLVRAVSAAALVWTAIYLGYRLAVSWHGADPAEFALLAGVETYNAVSLGFLAFFGWGWAAPSRPPLGIHHDVAVFITTYDEPVRVVEATLAGCAALHYPHRTYLLDDGRRPEMATLADSWGAQWVTRPDNSHAKAGNINHALTRTEGDLILVLDADHVPLADALDAVVGYFDDPDVALVQSPHDFYNHDSVQHYDTGRHEQSLFFEVVCPGKDRHNGVFWCGSATVIRRAALEQVGGVGTETIAEDFHTTVKMHRLGWKTRYHPEVLVQGLAPLDLDGYLLQRDRWARGNLAVFRLPESPLSRNSGLDPKQRLSYFASLFAYGAGASRLTMMVVLALTLFAGLLPARLDWTALLTLWLPASALSMLATVALSRGRMRLSESAHYSLITAEIFTRALRCAVLPSRTKFKVTPKLGADPGGIGMLSRLRVVMTMWLLLAGAVIWRIVGMVGWIHERHLPAFALVMAIPLAMWELIRMTRSLRYVTRRRQRRIQYRFACSVPAAVRTPAAVLAADAVDVSPDGVGLVLDEPMASGDPFHIAFSLPGFDGGELPIKMSGTVSSARTGADGRYRIGTRVETIDRMSYVHLLQYCYVIHPWLRLRGAKAVPAPPVASDAAA